MSDSEIKKQMEENDFFQFKKEMDRAGEDEFKRRYANDKNDKNAKEEAELEKCMVDLNQNDSKRPFKSISKESHNLANLETIPSTLQHQNSEEPI
jgi:hypothetical protein